MDRSEFMEQYIKIMEKTIIPSDIGDDSFNEMSKPFITLTNDYLFYKSLFRYRKCNDRDIDAFWEDEIYSSSPFRFNDPYDSLVYIDRKSIKEYSDKITDTEHLEKGLLHEYDLFQQSPDSVLGQILNSSKNNPQAQNFLDALKNSKREDFTQIFDANQIDTAKKILSSTIDTSMDDLMHSIHSNCWIACYSEDVNSALMWAHYADSHEGFALEYDYPSLIESARTCLYPVMYSDERYDATILALYYFELKAKDNIERIIGSNINLKKLPMKVYDRLGHIKTYLYKSKDWEYEKEWRSIKTTTINLQNNQRDTTPRKVTVKPKAVYLGTKIEDDHRKLISKLAAEKGIKIYQMELNHGCEKFELAPRLL